MIERPVPAPYTPQELWITSNYVVSIRAEQRMTSEDTADYYVHLVSQTGEKACWLQSTFLKVAELDLGGSNVARAKRGLYEKVKARLDWEKANEKELSEYKRLKAKFEGAPA